MIGEVYKEIRSLLKGKLTLYPAYQSAPERAQRKGIYGVLSPKSYTLGEKPEAVFVLSLTGSQDIEKLMSEGEKAAGILSEGTLRKELSFGSISQNKFSELEYPLEIKALLYEEEIPEEPEEPENPDDGKKIFIFPLTPTLSLMAESFNISRKRAVQEISTADGRSLLADGGERRLVFEMKGTLSSASGVMILDRAIADRRTFSFNAGGLLLPPLNLKSYEAKETGKSEFLQCELEFQSADSEGVITV